MISSHSITSHDLYLINEDLTTNIAIAEAEILNNIDRGVPVTKELLISYHTEMEKLAHRFRRMISTLFKTIKIKQDSDSEEIEKSQEYLIYTNVIGNITALIQHDIVNQYNYLQSILCTERWIYILKLCFEQNDFATSASIVYALNGWVLKKSGYMNDISPHGKAIQSFIEKYYTYLKNLYDLQEEKSRNHKTVLPSLSALFHNNHKLSGHIDLGTAGKSQSQKMFVQQQEANQLYIKFQTECDFELDNGNAQFILATLKKDINENLSSDWEDLIKSPDNTMAISPLITIQKTGLYSIYDNYYLAVLEFEKLVQEIFEMEISTTYKSKMILRANVYNTMNDNNIHHAKKLEILRKLVSEANGHIDNKFRTLLSKLEKKTLAIVYSKTDMGYQASFRRTSLQEDNLIIIDPEIKISPNISVGSSSNTLTDMEVDTSLKNNSGGSSSSLIDKQSDIPCFSHKFFTQSDSGISHNSLETKPEEIAKIESSQEINRDTKLNSSKRIYSSKFFITSNPNDIPESKKASKTYKIL